MSDQGGADGNDAPRQPMAVRLGFLLLIIVLIGHLWLPRGHWEPYPAVLLPAGAKVMHVGEALSYTEPELMAITAEGEERSFELGTFLYDLPAQYRAPLTETEFGLQYVEQDPSFSLNFGMLDVIVARTALSSKDADLTREWLHARLEETVGPGEYDEIIYRRIVYLQYPDRDVRSDTLQELSIEL